MGKSSGPVIRNMLRRAGIREYREYWYFFGMKCDKTYGVGNWRITRHGVVVGGNVVIKPKDYQAFVLSEPGEKPPIPAPEKKDPVEPAVPSVVSKDEGEARLAPTKKIRVDSKSDEEPTFKCSHRGCAYAGFTKEALRAHRNRSGH